MAVFVICLPLPVCLAGWLVLFGSFCWWSVCVSVAAVVFFFFVWFDGWIVRSVWRCWCTLFENSYKMFIGVYRTCERMMNIANTLQRTAIITTTPRCVLSVSCVRCCVFVCTDWRLTFQESLCSVCLWDVDDDDDDVVSGVYGWLLILFVVFVVVIIIVADVVSSATAMKFLWKNKNK